MIILIWLLRYNKNHIVYAFYLILKMVFNVLLQYKIVKPILKDLDLANMCKVHKFSFQILVRISLANMIIL